MPQLTITHSDGSTETIAETVGWTRKRELGSMRRATIDVERSLAQAVTLAPKQDTIELGSIDTLRLVDVETGGPTWRLIAYSLEWDANNVTPTDGGDLREGDDQTLINALIGEVGSWSAGTVENHTGPMSFVFNHNSRAEAIRRIEQNVPGEVLYRDGGTVDYLENLGTDKTATVTISAAAGNLEEEIQITNRGRELDGTHIRVLGAHEGEAQLFANLVPEDDPASYDNRVDYTTSRWSAGDTPDWDRFENKDVADQDTIETEAAALGEEITEGLVEAEAVVSGIDLEVGDWVRVVKPDADLDRSMRVHRLKEVVEGATKKLDVLFSTRTTVRKGDAQELADISRFNRGYQGASVSVQGGGSRQPVTTGINAEIPFDYPDLAYENDATLQVRGLPYRAYSSGAAAGAIDSDNTIPLDQGVSLTDGGSASDSFILPNVSGDASSALVYVNVHYRIDNSSFGCATLSISNASTGTTIYSDVTATTYEAGDSRMYEVVQAGDVEGDAIEVEIAEGSCGGGEYRLSYGAWILSEHAHQPQPGVIEFASQTPTFVDVLVNGSTVATNIGSGTFETEVDLSEELDRNQWNMIEVTSDSLGHIQASCSLDGYKKIGTQ